MRKIELKKISYNASLSEETSAYTAQLWVDGHHIANVSNHGQGGPDMQHPVNDFDHSNIAALDKEIRETYPKVDCSMFGDNHEPLDNSLELVCGDLLQEHLISRDLLRLLKRTVAFHVPGEKGIRSYKGKPKDVERAHLVTQTMRNHPTAVVLNNLPFDQALAVFKKNG